MRILAVDASTAVAGVAVWEDGVILAEGSLCLGLTHSQKLMPLVDNMLALADTPVGTMDAVATIVGPGSFTGLRIGVATAMGLAQTLGKPAVGVSTLEALAANIPFFGGVTVPLLDARRSQVYAGLFRWVDGWPVLVGEERALPLDQLLDELESAKVQALFLGDGVPVHREAIQARLQGQALFAPPHALMQRAAACAWLGAEKLRTGGGQDPRTLSPRYIRLPQAEQDYIQKHGVAP